MSQNIVTRNEKKEKPVAKKLIKNIRSFILAIFIIFISYEAYLHQILGGGSNGSPSIHALCPYGGLESLYSILFAGTLIKKVYTGTVGLFVITIILTLVFRRSFCGLICPFGAIQEFFAKIGQKIFGKRLEMPVAIDRPLRYVKYVILVLTAVAAWITGQLWMSPYDPWAAYAHIFGGIGELVEEYPIGFGLLIITVLGSIIYDRFFCKYLCPMGAFLGILAKVSPHRIVRNQNRCIDCGICDKNCPVNIEVAQSKEVTSVECINCQLCTLSCPVDQALEVKQNKRTLKPVVVIALVMLLYFGGIFTAKAAGTYQLLPQPLQPLEAGEAIDTEEIKGYMTLEEVSRYTAIPLEEIYNKLNIPSHVNPQSKMKELKEVIPGFDMHEAKERLMK